ncbi:unnamed protein product [Rotaria magnacalcarata]|uniref:Uncharacterized protein n=4 Tax=Rotaria magnacalcarata TaxID=392030 RepID=A0A816FTU2_9BILA|nr:unnamed protein product [Rotaria magnacalcarata]CAF2048315.1 unnamed protein product [Rotaria magnacalcarata]
MQNEKHKNNLKALKNNSQLTFSISTTSSTSSTHTTELVYPNKPLLFDDQVSQAEILWALKSVQNAFSYKNADDVGEVFRTMFPDSKIAQKFSIQHSKMSYSISHGLGPYFRDLLIKDIKNCERFVLCFDEETNNQNKKQLDLYFRYWSYAQANVVVDGILDAFHTDGIDIGKLLMLSRDNPNVNETVEKMINDVMKKVNAELLNIGTCNLHVIHNGFNAGTTETNWHVENFCMNIWSWFQKSPAQQEYFENIADELNDAIEKTILYFSSTRWALFGKVIDRVLNLHVLDPASRTKQDSADTMIRVGRAIPKLLSNAEIDRIRHEVMMYAAETIDQSCFGLPEYPRLSKIVKNILIISHGNSDVERGLSINENIVTENRTLLSLSSINDLRSTWNAIKFYGVDSPRRVPIKIDMIRVVQKSKPF